MNNFSLSLTAYYRIEVLERILRVIRHRGAHIMTMQMQENSDNTLTLQLTLSSERPAELLQSQLRKLIDVTAVEVTA